MESTSHRRGYATTVMTLMGLAAVTTLLPVNVGAQEHGSTRHQSSLPQITTGDQKDWPLHNLDLHGSRYADLDEINTATVSGLDVAWTFEAGAANSITQVTPLVVGGVMYIKPDPRSSP